MNELLLSWDAAVKYRPEETVCAIFFPRLFDFFSKYSRIIDYAAIVTENVLELCCLRSIILKKQTGPKTTLARNARIHWV